MDVELNLADNSIDTGEMSENIENVCSPLDTLEELEKCLKNPPKWSECTIKMKSRSDHVIKNTFLDCHTEDFNFFPRDRHNKKYTPKTLICHDMKNGYIEDKHINGINVGNGYTFYRWSQIDIFVYFSHHFITIPPLSWINVAHKNGVSILGTVITEWSQGKAICDEILKDEATFKSTADALVQLCLLFKLDGWLLNIENTVANPSNLRLFVQYLTDTLHANQKNTYIIWYDSVTKTGSLTWQNELNDENRTYFDVCDGIFLNYNWNETKLQNSVKQAQHRILDVYVGIDVFGRGSYGGGQFNSHLAAEVARKYNLSLAIFAQGWTHESLAKEPQNTFLERFHARDNEVWNGLWPYLYSHPIKYAFETTFHTGASSDYYDLQRQTYQLTNFLACENISQTETVDTAKCRCACLKDNVEEALKICQVSNEDLEVGKSYVHRLFSTEIFLDGKFTIYCYTKTDADYNIILLAQNKYQHITKIVCRDNARKDGDNADSSTGGDVNIEPITDNSFLRKSNIPKSWYLRAYNVSFHEDILLEIGLAITGTNSIDFCGFGIVIKL